MIITTDIMFFFKLLNGFTSCPTLLPMLNLSVPNKPCRYLTLFKIKYHTINYANHSPICRLYREANSVSNSVIFRLN